ncbi:MAG: hypothetical protein ACRC56_06800 [Bosea sp. (in: a-proteobacteria)]
MIALIKYLAETVAENVRFAIAVWHDARTLQEETEAKYGPLGF